MKNVKRYIILLFGLILISISFNLFCMPNKIVYGDILGFSLILNKLFSIDIFMSIFISNIILIVISYVLLGEEKTLATTTFAILLPFFIKASSLIPEIIIIEDLDIFIQAIIAGLATGFGTCLIYQQGFQIGGIEIIADLVKKYLKINSANINVIINSFLIILGAIIFGIEIATYGIIVLAFLTYTVRKYMFGINENKTFYIITNKVNEIKKYINEEEKQDVTIFDVITGLKKTPKKMIMSVLNTGEYYKIKTAIEIIDPDAFITITDSYQVINPSMSIRKKA